MEEVRPGTGREAGLGHVRREACQDCAVYQEALDSGSCFALPSPSLDSITNMAQASLSTGGRRSHLLPVCEGLSDRCPSLARGLWILFGAGNFVAGWYVL